MYAFGHRFCVLPRDAIHMRGHCRRAVSVRPFALTQLQTQLHSYKHAKSEDRVVFFEICISPDKGWVLWFSSKYVLALIRAGCCGFLRRLGVVFAGRTSSAHSFSRQQRST